MPTEPEMAATLVLTVAYDGTPFCGFARQEGLLTVQGELESALSTILRRPCEVTCAGRTDAGVHALGQVVSLPISDEERCELVARNEHRLLRSLDALTHDAIAIRDVQVKSEAFSARFDAVSREYRYRIVTGPVRPVFIGPWSWWLHSPELDLDAMQKAACYLIGEHDFKSFCAAKSAEGQPTCRYLESIEFIEETVGGEECLTIRIVGNAFLHNMVRIIVGTLVEVGLHRWEPEWMQEALEARDRTVAGPTAPAQGLTFWSVGYQGVRRH